LSAWAGAISARSRQGRAVFFCFDNDEAGYAGWNAFKVQDLLRKG
jgi:DNA primase